MNNEKRLGLLIINILVLLIIWIYPASFTDLVKVPTKILEPSYLPSKLIVTKKYVGSETYQVITNTISKTELVNRVEYQEQIGNKLVRTGIYKRVKYLGRYVFSNPGSSTEKVEYKYAVSYIANNIKYYAYDLYQIEEIIINEPIYETRYQNIYQEVLYPVYETRTKDIYTKEIELVGSADLLSNYNYLIDNKSVDNSYQPIIFLEPYKRYKIIFV